MDFITKLLNENYAANAESALMLMLTGMAGIFAVMILLLITIRILNKVTKDKNDDNN